MRTNATTVCFNIGMLSNCLSCAMWTYWTHPLPLEVKNLTFNVVSFDQTVLVSKAAINGIYVRIEWNKFSFKLYPLILMSRSFYDSQITSTVEWPSRFFRMFLKKSDVDHGIAHKNFKEIFQTEFMCFLESMQHWKIITDRFCSN